MVQVALSADFLTAFAKIPKGKQKRVREFTEKFRRDPTQPSLNYEPLHGVTDPKIRSVRIGRDYRAIVLHPPKGDVYVCVWVDQHDEAMAWARNKRFEINPNIGSLQIFEVTEGEAVVAAKAPSDQIPEGRLFSGRTDEELQLLGVPKPMLPAVRALRSEYDLDDLQPYLPGEAADALYLLAAGSSVRQVLDELTRPAEPSKPVDTEDFATALTHPDSQRRFAVVGSDDELVAMLRAPLEHWRVFLHPTQRKIVSAGSKGSMRVLGGAGTGKTVVLLHRARRLANDVFNGPNDRILVTTYTKNLALDLRRNLKTLCEEEAFHRLDVVHLHSWARRLLHDHGMKHRVVKDEVRRELWEEAIEESEHGLGLPAVFFREEWDRVVQGQGLATWEEYRSASRKGRGTRLSRKQRKAVWKVFAYYRSLLEKRNRVEFADVIREACAFLEQNPGAVPYKAVLADEVQDMSTSELKLLRRIVPEGENDIFAVGDAHQRIYGHKASLGSCGINIRGRRSHRLKINYRTTGKIRSWATALLEGVEVDDLDDGKDDLKGYRSLRPGAPPELHHFQSVEQETTFIAGQIREWLKEVPAEEICVVARKNSLLDDTYAPALQAHDLQIVRVARSAEQDLGPGVRLATMHRLKGLEFPRVIIASVVDGIVPLRLSESAHADAASLEDHEQQERFLMYVAATRARDHLLLTSYGERSRWCSAPVEAGPS